MKNRLLLLIMLFVPFAAASCAWPSHKARLQAYDNATTAGKEVVLRAKLERAGWLLFRTDLHRQKVNFYVDGVLVDSAVTGHDGFAEIKFTPRDAGTIAIRAILDESSPFSAKPSEAMLLTAKPGEKFLVADIDNTLARTTIITSLFLPTRDCPTLSQAAEVMNRLAQEYSIIYITSRDDSVLSSTRAWLSEKGFPVGPIFMRDLGWSTLSSAKYKTAEMRNLKERGINIVAAVGDEGGDARAAVANGIPVILITTDDEDVKGTLYARDWQEVEKIIASIGKTTSHPG
jgi:phosphoglycolate phosphatase-like HAD superfamily hydrolase